MRIKPIRSTSMENPITIRKRPVIVQAIQWTNNEPFVRAFVKNDRVLRFPDGKLELWNDEEKCWISCPMFHYIIKGIKGEFYPCSPEVFARTYDVITPGETLGNSDIAEVKR